MLVSSYNVTGGNAINVENLYTVVGPVGPGFEDINVADQWICGIQETGVTCDVRSAAADGSSWLFEEWDVQYVRPSPKYQLPKNMLMPNTASV